MGIRGRCLGAWAIIIAAGIPAAAQETLSLRDAYTQALERNEQVQIAREARHQGTLWPRRAYTLITPRITLSGTYTWQKQIEATFHAPPGMGAFFSSPSFLVQVPEQTVYQAGLLWTLYQGSVGPYWRQARRMSEGAEASSFQATQEVLFQVAASYYSLLRAQKMLSIARQAVTQAEAHLRQARGLFKVGQTTRPAVLRAEMEGAQARTLLVDAENAAAVAGASLSLLIGCRGEFRAVDTEEADPGPLDEDALVALARTYRQDLLRAAKDEDVAMEDRNVARGKFLPTVAVQGMYNITEPSGSLSTPDNWHVSLVLSLPLFQGGGEYLDLVEKRSQAEQARARKDSLDKQAALEVKKAILDVVSATKNMESLALARALARETSALVEEQFAIGAATSIEVTDAHTALVTAEQQYANGAYQRTMSLLSLQKATGMFARDIINGQN